MADSRGALERRPDSGGTVGVPIDVEAAQQLAGMTNDRPFSPGMPLQPFEGYSTTPRSRDYPAGVNISARPRSGERVAFDTLRGLIEGYDVAQMCIWHRISSIRSLSWSLVAMPGYEGRDVAGYVEVGMRALKKPDRRLRFSQWLAKYLYDVLAFDAGALYRMRNNAGRAIGLKVVDGTTIAPLVDYYGDLPMRVRPDDPAPPAYVQFANGVPWSWLTADDLIYEPFQPTSNSLYGRAPLETILLNANTDLRFQWYFIQRFTEGNIPEAFAGAPEGWTPDQIREFQDAWDALMMGDQDKKHQVRWVPHGTSFAWSNEKDFDDKFSLFLMRKTAASYHVTPQDLGFTEDVNRATSETQVDNQFRIGDLPLVEHMQGILDGFLQDDLGLPLCFQFDTGQEKEDRLATAQADKIYVELGAVGVSEIRERVFGLSEPDGKPVPRFIMTSRSGPVPLSALEAVAGPVDPESGAPEPGAQLPHKPFAPIEGVTPQKPPSEPPLAVVEYPGDNAESAQAAAVAEQAPVVKDAGEGLTTETSPASYDLIGSDDDEDGDEEVAKAAELASFRRFVRARRRDGRWRDFTFTTVGEADARRLNAHGRVQVRKAAGAVVAAGLAVRALDSGRVLMLQRGLDPEDPASGCWEFPGGCLEGDESPLTAACREWQEETGLLLPVEDLARLAFQPSGWTGSNGVYQGFVLDVRCEALIDLGDRGQVRNPDDPDGDCVEAIAWWDPRLLVENPAIRAELGVDAGLVLAALEQVGTPIAGEIVKAGGSGPKAGMARRRFRSTRST